MNVSEKIKNYIADAFNVSVDSIHDDTRFVEDIKADSLDLMDFIMEMEDTFNITIDDDIIPTLTTVGSAIAYVDSQVNK